MANSVKIPVELEMNKISSQISSLRQSLIGVKADSSSFKTLNNLLRNIEKSFNSLQTESKKTFSSQTEINSFVKGLEKINLQTQVYQDNLSRVDIKHLNIDASAFNAAVKKVKELENIINNVEKVGNTFKGTDIEKQLTINTNTTFDGLAKSFDEEATKIETRIAEINAKIQELGKKQVSLDDVGREFDEAVARRTTNKIDIKGRDSAAKSISDYFKTGAEESSADSINDFIEEQTQNTINVLKKRKEQLQNELRDAEQYNQQIANVIGGLTRTKKSDTVSQTKKDEIKDKLGITIPNELNKITDVKDFLQSKKINASNQTQELNKLNAITENIVRSKVEEIASSIKQTEELTQKAIAILIRDIQGYLTNQGFGAKITFRSMGGDETIENYKKYILEEIDKANKDIEESKKKLQNDAATQQIAASQQRAYASTVREAADKRQNEAEQAKSQLSIANQELETEAEVLRQVAEEATNVKPAVEGIDDATKKAGASAEKAAGDLQTLSTATESLGQIKRVISYWLSFRTVMRGISSVVKNAISTIHELDDVMTEIAIVTDFTQEDLWGQMDKYSSIAQEYGASIKGVYEISQLYMQQGLQQNQVWNLTTETLKMAKIANLDYATATDYMTVA